jgi:transposase
MEAGYRVHLANTAALPQYAGLKYSNDANDARWLAHLLRLGLLPEGYIYPKETRAVRDLLRKRSQLVRQRTSQVLSIENLVARNLGLALNGNEVKRLTLEAVQELLPDPRLALAVASNLVRMQTLDDLIGLLEKQVREAVRLEPAFQVLLRGWAGCWP